MFFFQTSLKIQEPERRHRERDQFWRRAKQRSSTAFVDDQSSSSLADFLPRPVTAPAPRSDSPRYHPIRPRYRRRDSGECGCRCRSCSDGARTTAATPTPANIAQQIRATTFTSITGRFIIIGTFILFLSLAATFVAYQDSSRLREYSCFHISFPLDSPDLRNVQRNSRRAFAWRFMIGQSLARISPIAYFYLRTGQCTLRPAGPVLVCLLGALAVGSALGPRGPGHSGPTIRHSLLLDA